MEILTGVESGYQAGVVRLINLKSLTGNYLLSTNLSKVVFESTTDFAHLGSTMKLDNSGRNMLISQRYADDGRGTGQLFSIPLGKDFGGGRIFPDGYYECLQGDAIEQLGIDFVGLDFDGDGKDDRIVSSANCHDGSWSKGVGGGLVRIIWGV
jgi:hypothetical protein